MQTPNDTSAVQLPKVTRNNVSIPLKEASIRKKQNAGTKYYTLSIPEDEAGQISFLKWAGTDIVQSVFQRWANALGQNFAFSPKVSELDETDKDNPKIVKIDLDKLREAFEELTVASGESIPVLEEKKEDLTDSLTKLMADLRNPNATVMMKAAQEAAKITESIQTINKQIEDRKAAYANVGRKRATDNDDDNS